jgi:hypothetical protein
VDDIIAPPISLRECRTASPCSSTTRKNHSEQLRVTAEGDFDTPESTSYFVGNLESGKSDSYDFSFIPRKGGEMTGKIIFSYEDAAGDVQILERAFSFDVMEEMPVFDEGMMPEEGMNQAEARPPGLPLE